MSGPHRDAFQVQQAADFLGFQYVVESALVSRNGGPWKERTSITAHPGDHLRFKVALKIWKGATTSTIVGLTVPASATGSGFLTIGTTPLGGGSDCGFDPSACPTTFNALLQSIRDAPRGDDLPVTLDLSAFDPQGIQITKVKHLDKVVDGSIEFPIDVN